MHPSLVARWRACFFGLGLTWSGLACAATAPPPALRGVATLPTPPVLYVLHGAVQRFSGIVFAPESEVADVGAQLDTPAHIAQLSGDGQSWDLDIDARTLPAHSTLTLPLSVTRPSRQWAQTLSVRVNVLPAQVRRVVVPAQGAQVRVGRVVVRFPAAAAARTVVIRHGFLPQRTLGKAAQITVVEAVDGAAVRHRIEPQAERPGVAPAATAQAAVSLTDALNATTPYASDSAQLGHVWVDYWANFIRDGQRRLPANDPGGATPVSSPSARLNGLLPPDTWAKTDWQGVTPVLFVHGYQMHLPADAPYFGGGLDTFGYFPDLVRRYVGAKGQRFAPFEFMWNTDAQFTVAAADLVRAITLIYETTGQPVTVVAHSFGGVLTRAAVQGLADGGLAGLSGKVNRVLSLGSPLSGIADVAGIKHGVKLPAGQDSLLFEACDQISCHAAGEPVTFPKSERVRLGLALQPGQDVASISLQRAQLPALLWAQGIGNVQYQKLLGDAWYFGSGDNLISHRGQRFFPELGVGPVNVWKSWGSQGFKYKEQLLGWKGGIRAVRPDQAVNAAALVTADPWGREYAHSPVLITGDVAAAEAWVPHDEGGCALPATCRHASWRLWLELQKAATP
jgi:Lipase (class 2)